LLLAPELARQACRAVEVRAVAHHQQVRWHASADAIEDLDDGRYALDRTEVRHVHDNSCRRIAGQALSYGPGIDAMMNRAVEKVRNHADIGGDGQLAIGVRPEAVGYGCHAIGLLDAER